VLLCRNFGGSPENVKVRVLSPCIFITEEAPVAGIFCFTAGVNRRNNDSSYEKEKAIRGKQMRRLSALIFISTFLLGVTAYGQSGNGSSGGSSGGSSMGSSGSTDGGAGGGTGGSIGGTDYGTTGTGGSGSGSYGTTGTTDTSGRPAGTTGTSGSTSTMGTGGATDTSGITGTGSPTATTMGTTGGMSGGTVDVATMKQDFQRRLDEVDIHISDIKKSVKDMSGLQKDTMNHELKNIKIKRDAVNKMIANMNMPVDSSMIENELGGLEQQVKSMSSGLQRSTPAGDMDSCSSSSSSMSEGGKTGGAAPMSTDKSMGGATGGAGSMSVEQSTTTRKAKHKKGAKKSTSGTTGTMTGTGSPSATKGPGGTTGGATGTSRDMDKGKQIMKDRLDIVDKEISAATDMAKDMPAEQKDVRMMRIDKVQGQRDGVKKMIDDLKSSEDTSKVESALNDLEQSSKSLSSKMQRSTPAGDMTGSTSKSKNTVTGGATGGAAEKSGSTSTMGAGGMSGGAVMEHSYDQRAEYEKFEQIRLDSFTKRIDALKSVAKGAPQNINSNLMPRVDELYGMKNDASGKIGAIKNADRNTWSSTKADVEKSMSSLEQKLMNAEKFVK
jgi:hypothetical protein